MRIGFSLLRTVWPLVEAVGLKRGRSVTRLSAIGGKSSCLLLGVAGPSPSLATAAPPPGTAHCGRRGNRTTRCASSQAHWTLLESFMQSTNRSRLYLTQMDVARELSVFSTPTAMLRY